VNDPRWLLLAYQLPTQPSKARVKTWRRLQQIGAVPTRNSVYVLPNTDQSREDFEWIRSEIVSFGGDAIAFAAEALGAGADDLVAAFQRARSSDYETLKRDAVRIASSSRANRRKPVNDREGWNRRVRRLRERFDEIERIDFFHAPAGLEAAKAIGALDRLGTRAKDPVSGDAPGLTPASFRHRRWVTRPRPGVDRMASAWLIRRFIDPKAAFSFVERPSDSDVPFDMYVGEFSHHGTFCTFETIAQRFSIVDPAVIRIGHIVHDLDMKEQRFAPPEAPAVARMVEGLQELYADDQTLLQHGIGMFEALFRSFSATESAIGRAVKVTKTRKGRR
jgi:hypothetical protein